jgi:hypothetical protein
MTMNDTWGSSRDNQWKSSRAPAQRHRHGVEGGNYRVGLTAEGNHSRRQTSRRIGKWMKVNGDAIYL